MTCIAAVVDRGFVYMGADSAGVVGYALTVRADQKVFINNGLLMGFTSSFRMGQLLRYAFKPPKYHPDEKDLFEYMVTDFVNEVRACLKSGGYAHLENGEETAGTFLVGTRGRLFCIEVDYQVNEHVHNFNAVGCGAAYALGSMFATQNESPIERVTMALTAAEQFSAGVRGPFHVLKLPAG